MSGKMSEVYDAYDMEILQSIRIRGALYLRTNIGTVQLRQINTSKKRIEAEYAIKESLVEKGFGDTDRCVRNKEGELITYDRYENAYVLRKAYEGRECNINSLEDLELAAKLLARFHKLGKEIYYSSEKDVHIRVSGDFPKRNRELRRIKAYVQKKSPKREFEEMYMDHFDYFYEQADECEKSYGEKDLDKENEHIGYCHGMYNQHSVIMYEKDNENKTALINFEKFYVGNQLADLYHFIRKTIEKNNYDFEYFKIIVNTYNELIKLEKSDMEYIFTNISYPEKFYKISNNYYNTSKNWISPKLFEKFNGIIDTEKDKIIFLEKLKEYINNY